VGAENGRRRGFRQPKVPHLAGADELGHRTHRVLNGRLGIDAMQVNRSIASTFSR
jgi:hypothetical protein